MSKRYLGILNVDMDLLRDMLCLPQDVAIDSVFMHPEDFNSDSCSIRLSTSNGEYSGFMDSRDIGTIPRLTADLDKEAGKLTFK